MTLLPPDRSTRPELENVAQSRFDRGARPGLALGRERLAGRAQLERGHPDALGSRQLVVGAVADEEALGRLDAEPLARDLVDPRIRLRDPHVAREDQLVECARERRLVPDVRHVLGADADQAEPVPAATELGEGLERVRPRSKGPLRPLAPHGKDLVEVRLCAELRRRARCRWSAIGPISRLFLPGEPRLAEALRLDPGGVGHPIVEPVRLFLIPRDQGLPEIEDDCAVLHFLSSFFTEPQGRVFRI